MKIHELKIDLSYFNEVEQGTRQFDLRYNKPNYRIGDILILKAYNPTIREYTGQEIKVEITSILRHHGDAGFGLLPGWVILGIKPATDMYVELVTSLNSLLKEGHNYIQLSDLKKWAETENIQVVYPNEFTELNKLPLDNYIAVFPRTYQVTYQVFITRNRASIEITAV